ncbi:hypothetical protein [uncultured Gammaproteobacteria bacterium]|nr:hypothetical protein [uncultured Gammaproteobacteria bacterium]
MLLLLVGQNKIIGYVVVIVNMLNFSGLIFLLGVFYSLYFGVSWLIL